MYNIKEIDEELRIAFTIDGKLHKRYYHSVGVAEMAVKLNHMHHLGLDDNVCYVTGLLHDCAKLKSDEELISIINVIDNGNKEMLKFKALYHQFAAAYVLEHEYGIVDEDMLSAVFYHSTARSNMKKLEQVIYVSDFIEEATRVYPACIEARKACFENLNYGTYVILKNSIDYIEKNNEDLYYVTREAYDYYKQFEKRDIIEVVTESLDKAVVADIRTYNLIGKSPFFDYSVVCSASSNRQAHAAIEYLRDDAAKRGIEVVSYSSSDESGWHLIDLGDVVVHVFVGKERDYYNLDGMYANK